MNEVVTKRTDYRVTLAVLALGAIAYGLLQSLPLPALPEVRQSLHTSEAGITWIITAFLLSASIGTPIIGRLGDIYGKERVLLVVLGVLALGTLITAIADSIVVMVLGRVIQGAAGGIFPLGFGIVRDEFPVRKVAGGIGLMSSIMAIGGGAGVVLSGPIVDHLSYHWLFWFPLTVIVAAAVATHQLVPESPVKVPGKVNWLAALLMSAGLTPVLVAASESTIWGWASFRTIGLIAAGLIVLGAWIAVESRAHQPLIDMRMMQRRGVWTANLVAFLVGVGMYSSFILIPQFVQEPRSTGYGFGASVLAAGIFLAPTTLAMVVVGQLTGRIIYLWGVKMTLMSGAVVSLTAFAIMTAIPSHRWQIYLASALLGVGIALAFAALPNLIVQNVGQDQTGAATGMNLVMRTIGGALGGQVAATFLVANPGASGLPSAGAYTLAFGLCGGALLGALAASFLISGRERTTPSTAG